VEQGVWNSPRRLLAAENAAPDVADRLTFRESGFQSRGEERPLASGSVDLSRPHESTDGGGGSEGRAGSAG
jgi:hypothetical protein